MPLPVNGMNKLEQRGRTRGTGKRTTALASTTPYRPVSRAAAWAILPPPTLRASSTLVSCPLAVHARS
eukprot:366461-Chlamydomonas_euryale.AAC.13